MGRTIAYVFGLILTVVGLWGFFQNPVIGIFAANNLHSIVHIGTGLVLLAAGLWWSGMGAMILKLFGVIYLALAVIGFVMGGDTVFGLIDNTLADQVLHLALAIVFLWGGFMGGNRQAPAPMGMV